MKVKATVNSKSQRVGEDAKDFFAREPDRVVAVELDDVVTNPDDMKGENVSYVGIRKPNPTDQRRKSDESVGSPFRGLRCPVCFWALYDGDYCQNQNCVRYGNSVHDPIRLSNEEAQERIKANDKVSGSSAESDC